MPFGGFEGQRPRGVWGRAPALCRSAPWRDEFYTVVPTIENGEFILPKGPGWGIDVNEAAVRARPPKT